MQGCLGKIGGAAEVAPVVFVGAEGEDFLALGGETEIDINDGEGAFLVEHVEEARGNDVNAREGKRRRREEARDWTARVARAPCSLWNCRIRRKSMVLMTSTL